MKRPPRDDDDLVLLGLSIAQARAVRDDPWDGSGVMVLHDDLPADLFETDHAHLVLNARELLQAVRDGPIALTPAGNLPRAAVASLLDRWRWHPGEREELHQMNKVINELDVPLLFDARELLQHAKYLKVYRRQLRITPAGRAALAPEATGRLAVRLFRAHFRELRFAEIPGGADPAAVQAEAPLLLWSLSIFRRAWFHREHLANRCRPDLIRTGAWHEFERFAFGFALALLEPLVDFGLLERRTSPERHTEYRKTPLLDRFITWRIPQPWPKHERWEHPLDRFLTPRVFGELSHAAAAAILTDPLDGTGPLRIAGGLPREAFDAPTLGLDNARRLLWQLDSDGSWTPDERDLLPPEVLARLLPTLEWWPGFAQSDPQGEEPGPVWSIRRLLTDAGLIRRDGPRLTVTAEGRRLIDPMQTGELAALLLRGELLDAGYEQESLDDVNDINRPVRRRRKLLLWRLSRLDIGWHEPSTLASLLTLPEMVEELQDYGDGPRCLGYIVKALVLDSLADFGLLECDLDTIPERRRYRRTGLFEKMLEWRI